MSAFKICIISDAICPFCYIGYRNLNKAISTYQSKSSSSSPEHPAVSFNVEFKPFRLDPSLTTESVVRRDKYAKKYGGYEAVASREEMMKAACKKAGINFSYDGNISQTNDYHRLMHEAWVKGGQDLQLPLAEELFKNYFEEGKDVGQWPVLTAAATSIVSRADGKTKIFNTEEEATEFFKSDKWEKEVQEGLKTAAKLQVHGVPFFCMGSNAFDQKFAVSGAQPPEVFLEVFEELAKKGKEVTATKKTETETEEATTTAAARGEGMSC